MTSFFFFFFLSSEHLVFSAHHFVCSAPTWTIRVIQSHIPFHLSFLTDHGLFGMSLLSCSTFSIRGQLPDRPRCPGLPSSLSSVAAHDTISDACNCSLPLRWLGRRGVVWTKCLQDTTSENRASSRLVWRHNYLQAMTRNSVVEVDVRSEDILADVRRHQQHETPSDAPFPTSTAGSAGTSPLSEGDLESYLVPSLRELWDNERRRRKNVVQASSQGTPAGDPIADTPRPTFPSQC